MDVSCWATRSSLTQSQTRDGSHFDGRPLVPSMLKKLFFGCFAFAVLSFMILQSPAWKLRDFDQIFYVTIAYDLDKYVLFCNRAFDAVDWSAECLSVAL